MMRREKRSLPEPLLRAEAAVEEWRAGLIRELPARGDIATYHLLATVGTGVAYLTQQLMPDRASELEMFARDLLFGAQFALERIAPSAADESFTQHRIQGAITEADARRTVNTLEAMTEYSRARDLVISYGWSGYELVGLQGDVLRFVDQPDWPGRRDYAEQIIGVETKTEFALSMLPTIAAPVDAILEAAVDLPRDLPLGGVTAEQVIRGRFRLSGALATQAMQGETPIFDRPDLVAFVRDVADLTAAEAARLVELLMFDRSDLRLSLFHCPVVPLTAKSVAISLPGLIFGNPTVAIPRLAVLRGPGLDAFSNRVEAYVLARLKSQFEREGVTVKTNIHYSIGDERGEIDLVVYDRLAGRVLIGQVKAFIPPDTVEEVIRANIALDKGLGQVAAAKRWIATLPAGQVLRRLNIEHDAVPTVEYVVIGNGFAGSDYLEIPDDVPVVNGAYLLLKRFRGGSIFDAIARYRERLAEELRRLGDAVTYGTIEVGSVRMELPTRRVSVALGGAPFKAMRR